MRVPYSIELLLDIDRIALELETTTDELDIPTDELEDLTTEDDSETDELDCSFALELETTTDELDTPTDELEKLTSEEEFICSLLEENSMEDELSSSDSELLFPLSLSHAAKIRATATMPNNTIRCFCFIFFAPCLKSSAILKLSQPSKQHF